MTSVPYLTIARKRFRREFPGDRVGELRGCERPGPCKTDPQPLSRIPAAPAAQCVQHRVSVLFDKVGGLRPDDRSARRVLPEVAHICLEGPATEKTDVAARPSNRSTSRIAGSG